MKPQTEHNRRGHERARARGFKSLGPTSVGWRDAKVACLACGHELPWYHERYQELHRSRCELPEVDAGEGRP